MTEQQFLDKMDEVSYLEKGYVCNTLKYVFGKRHKIHKTFYKLFTSNLKDDGSEPFLSYDECGKIILDDKAATSQRMTAILLFEEICLEYKLYEKF